MKEVEEKQKLAAAAALTLDVIITGVACGGCGPAQDNKLKEVSFPLIALPHFQNRTAGLLLLRWLTNSSVAVHQNLNNHNSAAPRKTEQAAR